MPYRKSVGVIFGTLALSTLAPSAGALTLEEAMEKCRAQYDYQGDTDGAPKQHLVIEACARQMVRNSPPEPVPASQSPGQRH